VNSAFSPLQHALRCCPFLSAACHHCLPCRARFCPAYRRTHTRTRTTTPHCTHLPLPLPYAPPTTHPCDLPSLSNLLRIPACVAWRDRCRGTWLARVARGGGWRLFCCAAGWTWFFWHPEVGWFSSGAAPRTTFPHLYHTTYHHLPLLVLPQLLPHSCLYIRLACACLPFAALSLPPTCTPLHTYLASPHTHHAHAHAHAARAAGKRLPSPRCYKRRCRGRSRLRRSRWDVVCAAPRGGAQDGRVRSQTALPGSSFRLCSGAGGVCRCLSCNLPFSAISPPPPPPLYLPAVISCVLTLALEVNGVDDA